jgi:hypothetical protein
MSTVKITPSGIQPAWKIKDVQPLLQILRTQGSTAQALMTVSKTLSAIYSQTVVLAIQLTTTATIMESVNLGFDASQNSAKTCWQLEIMGVNQMQTVTRESATDQHEWLTSPFKME